MAAPFRRDTLPENCSYGVCRDGRVFFIDDETCTTTWLHPRTGEPVNSGHMIRSDLPTGWEEGFTKEGASFFIDHNQRTTTFIHPVTGQISAENTDFRLQDQTGGHMLKQPQTTTRPSSTISEASTNVTSSTVDTTSGSKGSKSSGRVHSFGKRDHAIKRNPSVPVVVRGWLHKQDSSGMRLWKRKWFVLADYCLFYYKDSREESVLGSIPLPSYTIAPVGPEDHISRKYAFKATHTGMRSYIYKQSSVIGSQAEHTGMRTYYFSADTQEDMNGWVRAMNQAALMQTHTVKREESDHPDQVNISEKLKQQAVPQTNHINSYVIPEPEVIQSDGPLEEKQEGFVGEVEIQVAQREIEQARGKSPASRIVEVEVLAPASKPASHVPSRAPSRAVSTPPVVMRNGTSVEQNGIPGYQRGPTPSSQTPIQVQRKSALEKVENWVKVQKEERQGFVSTDGTIPRRTPPIHPKYGTIDKYQSLPKTTRQSPLTAHRQLPSEYKYSHDRLNHFQLTHGHTQRPVAHDNTVWQLYEWQQRQQYRHGSPTAPVYTPAPDYSTAVSSTRVNSDVSRSISVPPTLADIPPPGPPGPRLLSPRRPHTPAERVTVKPLEDRTTVEVPPSNSPHRLRSYKSATIERRSMPPSGYITHTVSAPSLHGKTPEELTLLLIQLRRHQAMMAGVRNDALAHLQQLSRADDTYMHLKKDLDYLDLKMKSLEPLILMVHSVLQTCTAGGLRPLWNVSGTETLKGRPAKPVKVAESDIDVTLSRLCEQDKILQELEFRLSGLKDDKDKLESVLDVSHQQMEQYKDQPAHTEKIAYQQRLLQEDLVHIRADISRVSTEMERAWDDYSKLEQSVEQLRDVLQTQMNLCTSPQEKNQLRRELWRIEDVMTGLSSTKETFKITIDSVKNPERKLVPSVTESAVPSRCMTPSAAEVRSPQRSLTSSPLSLPLDNEFLQHPHPVPKWEEDDAPPRPPLPLYYDEDTPPVVPPLPKETSVIRHTSVRGLKRQSDERKRDRESSYINGDCRVELRSYLSEPELPGSGQGTDQVDPGYLTLQRRGLSGSSSRINQYGVAFCSQRRGDSVLSTMERPKSALERLCSGESQPDQQPQRGRMSVEEQLERMKRHQRALVRERKRNLSQGERQPVGSRASTRPVSSDPGSGWDKVIDLQRPKRTLLTETQRPVSDEWLTVEARPMSEQELETVDFEFDLTRELSTPQKVPIPKRLMEVESDEDLTPEEKEARSRTVSKIKSLLSKSSGKFMPQSVDAEQIDFTELDSALQQQERIMSVPRALATEAFIKRKQVTANAMSDC
ncbi:pleckstrin homology domain-containing family A member 7 isoform X2 [Ctenopharyngodon idella]|uniref:pleckstrin homology domain-containing family A member 7 isoform X2 n=1 Tax=Ctenopharyngodon idella TaxID=7959 RepID=UPI00222F4E39|nr:pleckstrin homology domain-containing family A member 7 isoform X2 [Ctenopharyngodon idella]